jgi:predicted kinase
MFDHAMQAKTVEAMAKLHSRDVSVTEGSLRAELDFDEREWIRFGKDIIELVEGIPNASSSSFQPSTQVMIMLVGIPGSGKSTFATKLVEATGDIYVRVNQDEMGNRQACEAVARTALKKGYSVIVDRVNFDIKQRNNWVKLASELHVNNIRCLFLDVPLEVAKERIAAREDHPTIPKGTNGHAIIDKFTKWQINPSAGEGFCEIVRASTQAEIDAAFDKFKALIEPEVLEDGWSSGQGRGKGRGPALKKSSQIAEDDDNDGNDLNSSGGKSKLLKPKESKAPDIVAYNPFDMLNDTDDNDNDDNDE